jgi:hypothetical protein
MGNFLTCYLKKEYVAVIFFFWSFLYVFPLSLLALFVIESFISFRFVAPTVGSSHGGPASVSLSLWATKLYTKQADLSRPAVVAPNINSSWRIDSSFVRANTCNKLQA